MKRKAINEIADLLALVQSRRKLLHIEAFSIKTGITKILAVECKVNPDLLSNLIAKHTRRQDVKEKTSSSTERTLEESKEERRDAGNEAEAETQEPPGSI